MTTLYGISNCDTIKKAKKYLTDNAIDYTFHDYRKDGINLAMISEFANHIDWQELVNKRGTTYRQLTDEQKQNEELISGCVAGAIQKEDYISIMKRVGFEVRILGEDKEISKRQYQGINLESLKIEAIKRNKNG